MLAPSLNKIHPIASGSVYLNVDIVNNDQQDGLIAQFSANLAQDLVDHAGQHDVAIVRMRYPNSLIPLSTRFQDDDYSVSISLGDSIQSSYNSLATRFLVNDNIPNGDDNFILSYADWTACINAALQGAWEVCAYEVITNGWQVPDPISGIPVPRTGPPLDVTNAPYIKYDPDTKLFSIYLNQYYFNSDISDTRNYGFNLWFNTAFNSIFAFNTSSTAKSIYSPFGDIYYILNKTPISDFIVYTDPDGVDTDATLPDTNILRQTFRSLSMLSGLGSVVVTTSLPITPEVSVVNINGESSAGRDGGFNFRSVLTDFEISTDETGRDLAGYDTYSATGYQRRYTMNGFEGIRNINLQLFWKTNTGMYFPLVIPLYTSVNIKLEFRRISRGEYVTTN